MGTLYLGPLHWPLTPPLAPLRLEGPRLGIIVSAKDASEVHQALLENILKAVHGDWTQASLWQSHSSLSWGRLGLLPYPYVWILGKGLLPVPVGLYDLETGQRLAQLPSDRQRILWRLPTLSDMQQNPAAKKEAWQWLKPLYLS